MWHTKKPIMLFSNVLPHKWEVCWVMYSAQRLRSSSFSVACTAYRPHWAGGVDIHTISWLQVLSWSVITVNGIHEDLSIFFYLCGRTGGIIKFGDVTMMQVPNNHQKKTSQYYKEYNQYSQWCAHCYDCICITGCGWSWSWWWWHKSKVRRL